MNDSEYIDNTKETDVVNESADDIDSYMISDMPSEGKKTLFKKIASALRCKKYLGFCFLIPALVMFFIYFFMHVYPNGENSVLVLDLNGQYVYFFESLRNIITKGGSFVYSFGRALGGEFMGIFAYYLASPLSYIVALFPKENITEALYLILVLKCGLCGFTFGIYTHNTRPRHPLMTVMFSCMYALSSFAVVMQHNLMWTDCLILFPLVLLGIERMIKKGNLPLFVISLSLAVLSNFYIGYMMCIFSGIYFFFYYFSRPKEEINPFGTRFHFLKSFARMAVSSLCAVCISAVIILPTLYSLKFGKTTFSDPSYLLTQKFDFADMLTKLYFGSYDTVRPEGLPFLYNGMLTLLLFPLFFVIKKIPVREKIASGLLAVIMLFSMNASTLDLLWHGMQKPNWLNYRYAFMISFFMVFFAMRVFEHLKEINFKYIAASFVFFSALLVILQKIGYDNLPATNAVWVSLILMFVFVLILRGNVSDRKTVSKVTSVILVTVVVGELFAAGITNLYALDNDVVFSDRTGYRTFMDRVRVAVDDVKENDPSFYRMEKTFHRKTNDNIALGMFGLSGSTSTLNASTIKYLNRMGLSSKSHWTKYLGGTPVCDSLLGIKYLLSEHGTNVYEYEKISDYEDENIEVYENRYALSLCCAVSPRLTNVPFTDDTGLPTPFEKMNCLIGGMLGDTEPRQVFKAAKVTDTSLMNTTEVFIANHKKYESINSDSSCGITFFIEVENDGPLYCYFPSEYSRESSLFVNGTQHGSFYGNETFRIVELGSFAPGEIVTVRIQPNDNELYLMDNCDFFWYLDSEEYESAMTALRKGNYNITEFTEDHFKGTVSVGKENTQIFTSIPYDEGWKVKCDGKEVKISKVLDALITFELAPGEHTLELDYAPDSVTYGNIVSVLGVISFILIAVSNMLIKKNSERKRRAALCNVGSYKAAQLPDAVCTDCAENTESADDGTERDKS